MTIWHGIHSHSTDVDDTPGVSAYQANTRLQKQGELQRRCGFLSSAIAKQSGPILYIMGAHGLGNSSLTFNLGGNVDAFGTSGGSLDPWPPPPEKPKKRKPKGDKQGACTLWGPFGDGGTDSAGPLTFTLPASSCPGTLIFTASEDSGESGGSGGSGSHTDYGYSVDASADGVPIITSGCLVNDSAFGVIPAGTLSISYTVTAGCAGGSTPGSWSIQASHHD